ncbi:MAG: hypothetical protein GY774_06200, partial [Planctomycetes bacterium]|nr:hypothetical protein [Planctomycetota bacterium]
HDPPTGKNCSRSKNPNGRCTTMPGGSKPTGGLEQQVATLLAQNEVFRRALEEEKSKRIKAEEECEEMKAEDKKKQDDAGKKNANKEDDLAAKQATSAATLQMEELMGAVRELSTKIGNIDDKVKEMDEKIVKNTSQDDTPAKNTAGASDSKENGDLAERLSALLGLDSTGATEEEEKSKGKTMKSGYDLRAEDKVKLEAPWPHVRILRVPEMKGASYESLTPTDFALGYLLQAHEPEFASIKDKMMKHLFKLLTDHSDFPDNWENIRGYHAYLLKNIERGLLTWDDHEEFTELRHKYVYASNNIAKKEKSTSSSSICNDFNKGTCTFKRDHGSAKHGCSHCWAVSNRLMPHTQSTCYRLHGAPKPGAGTDQGDKLKA